MCIYIYVYAHTYYVHYIYVHIHRSCFLVFECAGIGFGVKPKNLPHVRFHFAGSSLDMKTSEYALDVFLKLSALPKHWPPQPGSFTQMVMLHHTIFRS